MVDRDWDENSGFVDIELAHAGAQGAAVQVQDLGRAVLAADFPMDLFQHPDDIFAFHIVQGSCGLR